MITKIKLKNTLFALENRGFIQGILNGRYKDTNYAIHKNNNTWVVYLLDGDEYAYLIQGYNTKKSAIKAIESGDLRQRVVEQTTLYNEALRLTW